MPLLCRAFKRSLDVVVASLALMLALPTVVVAAVLITRDSPGGWLFTQPRVGVNGRRFRLYKLRTMYADNDPGEHQRFVASLIKGEAPTSQAAVYKLTSDARVTRVGRWLRQLSIDEIPQLLNVLQGDMSLVGPRPPLPREVALYDERAWRRLAVKPGITGLWQVSGRSRLTHAEMVSLDIRYWSEWTPLVDLSILLRTPKVVMFDRDTA